MRHFNLSSTANTFPDAKYRGAVCEYPSDIKSRRSSETTTGRSLALDILKQSYQLPTQEIPKGAAGEPRWPDGIAGSISHRRLDTNHSMVVVAVATSQYVVGIDIEPCASSKRLTRLTSGVFDADEISILEALDDHGLVIGFSAKEAVYKALFPLVQKWFWFHKVRIISATSTEIIIQPASDLFPEARAFSRLVVRWSKLTIPNYPSVILTSIVQ